MSKYICEKCGKGFKTNTTYKKHLERKTPCIKVVSTEYSDLSYKLTKLISKIEKKNNGIYFTPPSTIERNMEILKPYMKNINTILEPSCGSCEYVLYIHKLYSKKNITGIELNKTIFKNIEDYKNDKIQLFNDDFIKKDMSDKYNLIIGNPPFAVLKKNAVPFSYYEYFDGRPNIFILFIIKSLQMLTYKGILSFILPKNFLNCLYYDKTRKYIFDNYKILHIEDCNVAYLETTQDTILFIVQNIKGDNTNFTLQNEYTIFGTPDNIIKINKLYESSTTLKCLNFKVNVGTVVWNQCKKILTNDSSKTLLIYSSDIKNNKLEIQKYTNDKKKNYIDKKGTKKPVLVVNRGYGKGQYNFEYCLINGEKEYLIENHLICIKYTKSIENDKLIILYEKIINSLKDERTKEFIKLYFGNNAINTTELCEVMPFYFKSDI